MEKTALVIGGTGGIGSAISRLFATEGIKTYATYYQNEEKANNMKDSLKNFHILQCDITKENDVKRMINAVLKNQSQIDILVNATTTPLELRPFDSLTVEKFRVDIKTIILGSVNVFKYVIPIMKKNKSGIIINILTSAIFDFPKRMSSYTTAKSGLFGLMNSLSKELDPFNVRVLGISPSFVNTKLIRAFPAKLLEIEKEKIIPPEEIAKLVLNLIKDEKKYPNGTNILLKERKDVLQYI